MDLMYSCPPDFDMSFHELLEVDLKSEMDRIIAAASGNSSTPADDLMAELDGPPISEEGFDEFDIRGGYDVGGFTDPFGFGQLLNHSSLSSSSKPASELILPSTLTITNLIKKDIITSGAGVNHHQTRSSSHRKSGLKSNSSWNSSLGSSLTFEEQYGVMVDPSSIVPVSVSSSSASGSETEPESIATDEDESENEIVSRGGVATWVVPSQENCSRSPSPTTETEFDEPEYIITTEPIFDGQPPAKKRRKQKHEPQPHIDGKIYPKPAFSYSCLIAMALKNSKSGSLPVSEIYKFMCDHFPYFKTAPSGWKNSVRHNLSLNKCFEKIEKPGNGARKGCLWALNPQKIHKMDEEVQKWSRKDPAAIRRAMSDPENLELIERGEMKRDYSGNGASDEDEEEEFSEPATPLTPAQVQARRSRINSSDSTTIETFVTSSPATTISQIHAATIQRPSDQRINVSTKKFEETLEIPTITNIQGNYICTTGNGPTYTLSFQNINNSTAPIIIRRTSVK